MDEAAAPETCCAMMPEARLRKGWISSARPAGEKILQWCFWMRGARRGSVLMRWVRPRSRRWVVVVVGIGSVMLVGLGLVVVVVVGG